MTTTTTLAAKIATIMGEIKPMLKTERAGSGSYGYNFISVNAMIDIARPKLAAEGIIFYGDVETIERVTSQTRNGNEQVTVYLHVRWFLSNGTEEISFRTIGEAADTGDKASNKAYTAAQKQAISKLLMMSGTDDDSDRDISPQDEYRAPAPVNNELENKLDEAGKIIKQLATQFVLPPREIIQVMIDDEKIPSAWEQSSAMKTVDDVQEFIDAANTYLTTED
jgi:hypothetical protein